MINLIPPAAKKRLKFEYGIRVISVWLFIWSVAFLIGASLLFPTYVLIGSQISVFTESAEIASENVTSYENVSQALVQSSLQARLALDEANLPAISKYLSLFKSLETSEIAIERISIRRDESGIQPIQLVGEADNRQALANFRDAIVSKDEVLEVDLPINNLAQDSEISFSLTVVINNEINL